MPFQSTVARYGDSLLPIITTKKIHISSKEKTIEVDFALNIPGDAQTRRMLMSSEIANMYYFTEKAQQCFAFPEKKHRYQF